MEAGTQAYRQTEVGRLMKTKAQAFDLKAIFIQNSTKRHKHGYRQITSFYVWGSLVSSGVHHFVLTHSPGTSNASPVLADSQDSRIDLMLSKHKPDLMAFCFEHMTSDA